MVRADGCITAPRLPIRASAAHVLLCRARFLSSLASVRDPSEEGGPDDAARRDAKSSYAFGRLNPNEGERAREREGCAYAHM